jgi:hypothetical protein
MTTMTATMTVAPGFVTGGVDTHLDVHVAAALDHVGGVLGTASFPTTSAGYQQLLEWLRAHSRIERIRVGLEGESVAVGILKPRYASTAGACGDSLSVVLCCGRGCRRRGRLTRHRQPGVRPLGGMQDDQGVRLGLRQAS